MMLTTEQREVIERTARQQTPVAADAIRQAVLDLDEALMEVDDAKDERNDLARKCASLKHQRDTTVRQRDYLQEKITSLDAHVNGLVALGARRTVEEMPALSHYCYYVSYRHETAAEDSGHVTLEPPVKGWGHIEIVLNRPIRSFEDVRVLAGFIQRKNEFGTVAIHSWQFMEDWSSEAPTYQEHIAADGTVTPAPVSLSLLT
jgi:FtsZ-binding cell division protein ZapB